MLYPTRFQVRHSTVLVIVLLLMGSVLYEVTRTEPAARQHAARTQDIALPADKPIEHRIRPTVRPDYIGRASVSSVASAAAMTESPAIAAGTASVTGATVRTTTVSGNSAGVVGGSSAPGRVRSSSGSGYAAGGFGMSGVGAWGGASGMVRPSETKAAAPAKAPKPVAEKKASAPKPRSSGGGGGTSANTGVVATLLPGGFTTGAAAVQSGAVAAVQGSGTASPASSPAATPEPMSMFLMGSGLVALYGVRRRFQ